MERGNNIQSKIKDLLAQLYEEGTVLQNHQQIGRNSQKFHKFDFVIKDNNVLGLPLFIVVNVPAKPISVKIIDNFFDELKDVQATKGVLISQTTFTEQLFNYAKKKNIELSTVTHLNQKNWDEGLKIPMVYIDNRWDLHATLSGTIPGHLQAYAPTHPREFILSFDKINQVTLQEHFINLWNRNVLNNKPNKFHNYPIKGLFVFIQGDWYPLDELVLQYQHVKTGLIKYVKPKEFVEISQISATGVNFAVEDSFDIKDGSWQEFKHVDVANHFFPGLHIVVQANEKLTPELLQYS
ncbi:restriction endonuclease [Mucilaginibacter pedocola]|uniref:Uncharacterized protein n=1 Tax=Mucilaginibacter pedocola TaxID=1792845 RepID=A0A1S9P9U8_9SPHI|nr:restriction endonuclease [Mucilaginibacter pedocola]OOQ57358.1 hypothetical protein BC343_14740 [Mucilaginibacter pedocola]